MKRPTHNRETGKLWIELKQSITDPEHYQLLSSDPRINRIVVSGITEAHEKADQIIGRDKYLLLV